jgi:hypothetical protein
MKWNRKSGIRLRRFIHKFQLIGRTQEMKSGIKFRIRRHGTSATVHQLPAVSKRDDRPVCEVYWPFGGVSAETSEPSGGSCNKQSFTQLPGNPRKAAITGQSKPGCFARKVVPARAARMLLIIRLTG